MSDQLPLRALCGVFESGDVLFLIYFSDFLISFAEVALVVNWFSALPSGLLFFDVLFLVFLVF
jgi:hypothetical protein